MDDHERMDIHGSPMTSAHVAPGYERAAEAFGRIAAAGDEAQLAAYVDGELVLDLACGIGPDAVMTVFSTSKGLAAIALARLVDEERLDLDAVVAAYWPEFADAGKAEVTVRQLLSHQAGLPETDEGVPASAWLDDHEAAGLLAAQLPFWRPGAGFGYHAVAIGSLMSELCFRITGRPMQQQYESDVRSASGADAYLGLPAALESRVVELQPMADPTPEQLERWRPELEAPRGPYGPRVFGADLTAVLTSREGRAFGHPAGGGVCSARGIAAVYDWATGYGRDAGAVSATTLARFAQTQVAGYDLVLDQPYRSHGIVFQKPTPAMPFGSHRAFGHDGAAGAMAYADPASGVVLASTIRRAPFPGGLDRRVLAIGALVRETAGR